MATTQGFTLSALPGAQQIPSNVGEFDSSRSSRILREQLEVAERMAALDAQQKAKRAALALSAKQDLAGANLVDAEAADKAAGLDVSTKTNRIRSNVLAQSAPDATRTGVLAAKTALGEQESALGQQNRVLDLRNRSKGEVDAVKQRFEAVANLADPNAEADELEKIQQDFPWIAQLPEYKPQYELLREHVKDARQRALKAQEETAAKERAVIAANAGMAKTADTNVVRRDVAQINADASRERARITSSGAVTNKAYSEALAKNEKIQEELQALNILDKTAEEYLGSFLGSGPVVGSGPAITLRTLLGDDTGKNFVAATAQSMKSAVETMRGLGAMSEREFDAAMSQLPKANEPESAIRLKLEYLHSIRPWIAARNALYLDKLERGATPMQAGEAIRRALPMPVPGQSGVTAESPAQFEVGKTYTDAQGNKARFLGEGKWEEVP